VKKNLKLGIKAGRRIEVGVFQFVCREVCARTHLLVHDPVWLPSPPDWLQESFSRSAATGRADPAANQKRAPQGPNQGKKFIQSFRVRPN